MNKEANAVQTENTNRKRTVTDNITRTKETKMSQTDKQRVGSRIKEYRRQRHISQETMAELLGISTTSVSNIERGINCPSFDNFIRIANVLEVSSDLLLSDVLRAAGIAKAGELSARLEQLPPKTRLTLLAIAETLIRLEQDDRETVTTKR